MSATEHQDGSLTTQPEANSPTIKHEDGPSSKISITIGSGAGARIITWEAAKADIKQINALPFERAAPMMAKDFASALRHVQARPDISFYKGLRFRNEFYLPRKPANTTICSAFRVPDNLKAHVPEGEKRRYVVILEFPKTQQTQNMLQEKAKALNGGAALEYTKDELMDVCKLSMFEVYPFHNWVSYASRFRGYEWRHLGKYTVYMVFPGTRAALDAMLSKIQGFMHGQDLVFVSEDLAHVTQVQHACFDESGSERGLEYWKDFGPIDTNTDEDTDDEDTDDEDHMKPFELQFARFEDRDSQELVDQHAWLEQDRAFYSFYKRQTKKLEPEELEEDDGDAAVPGSVDDEDYGTVHIPSKSDVATQTPRTDIDAVVEKALKVKQALLDIDEEIARLSGETLGEQKDEDLGKLNNKLSEYLDIQKGT